MATLLLDLYGVLVDSEVMAKAYNERMAAILHRRYGGSIDVWRELQQRSYEWYLTEGLKLDSRPDTEREGDAWVDAVRQLGGDQIAWMFSRAGVPLPPSLVEYAEQLEEETVQANDACFEDVRTVLPSPECITDDNHARSIFPLPRVDSAQCRAIAGPPAPWSFS